MKLLPVVLAAFLAIGCAANPKPPTAPTPPPTPTIAEIVSKSIVRITVATPDAGTYVCTGFSIEIRKFLTDEHCVAPLDLYPGSLLYADDIPAFVLKKSVEKDLAVIMVDIIKPPLTFNIDTLVKGQVVQAIGYGYGFTEPTVTEQIVAILNYRINSEIYPGTIYLHPFIGGMSGGPVFDGNGYVVGIVQRGTETIGYGVDVKTILDFLRE